MLLKLLEAVPYAQGTGIDVHGPDIERARAKAEHRKLAERATFIHGSSADSTAAADLVINVGSYQAFGTIPRALAQLHHSTNPSGRLVFGAEFWSTLPTDDQLAQMWEGATVDDCLLLPDLIDAVAESGWRVLDMRTSTLQEWEEFECGHLRDREEWLVSNSEHELATQVRDELNTTRMNWLRGHRNVMGFVTLILADDGDNDQTGL
jgi:SAM-dependent methyltransferase